MTTRKTEPTPTPPLGLLGAVTPIVDGKPTAPAAPTPAPAADPAKPAPQVDVDVPVVEARPNPEPLDVDTDGAPKVGDVVLWREVGGGPTVPAIVSARTDSGLILTAWPPFLAGITVTAPLACASGSERGWSWRP